MIRERSSCSGSGVVCATNDSAESPLAFELLRALVGVDLRPDLSRSRAAVADDALIDTRCLHRDRCGPAAGEDSQRRAKGAENQRGVVALLQGPAFPSPTAPAPPCARACCAPSSVIAVRCTSARTRRKT